MCCEYRTNCRRRQYFSCDKVVATHLRIANISCNMPGTTDPPYKYIIAQWVRDQEDRWKHFILSMVLCFKIFITNVGFSAAADPSHKNK